jgi:tRNA pseudouridine38-40 synthase
VRNLRMKIAYHGAKYSGWQVQPNVPTVQGTIETILERMTQTPVRLRAAGRTDAGVHALGQLANFRTDSTITLLRFHRGLNSLLPADISIVAMDEVALDFDSRRHNHGKHYRYRVFTRREPSVLEQGTSYHLYRELDIAKMVRVARQLVGRHDFAAFRAIDCDRETTARTLYRASICWNAPHLQIDVEGTAFLKNMVRIIAGTVLEIGYGRLPESTIRDMLVSGDRTLGGLTAPAHALTLMRVFSH